MCGIVGVVRAGGVEQADRDRVATAVVALRHRGPDGSAIRVEAHCVLGHTRLSIVDVAGGAQPMANEDDSVVTVYNGEIWNHLELRKELEKRGHRFRTRCDTEVIVHGYEEWGDDLPTRLNGMFALAVWDVRRARLLVARDRIGKKPLYVSELDGGLVFGSDARSVLLAGNRKPELDTAHLAEYLFQRYVGAPRTLFKGVSRLRPGHLMTFEAGKSETRAYWSIDPEPERDVEPEELRALLLDAVSKRLMSDVPLGVLLSGGVDSAAVLGLMREAGADSLASFTIGFDDPLYDERDLARVAATRQNRSPRARGRRRGLLRSAPAALLVSGRAHCRAIGGSVAPAGRARRAAREGRALRGRRRRDLRRLPEISGGASARAGRLAPLALRIAGNLRATRPSSRRWRRAVKTLSVPDPLLRWASWFRSHSPEELHRLLAPELRAERPPSARRSLGDLLRPYEKVDPGRRMLLGDLLTYLPDNMLLRGDKVLMGASSKGACPCSTIACRARVENACVEAHRIAYREGRSPPGGRQTRSRRALAGDEARVPGACGSLLARR